MTTIVLVEGDSDAAAVCTLAAARGMPEPDVRAVGGSKGIRRAVDALPGRRLIGLVDAPERSDFERFLADGSLSAVFVCDPDLEAELIASVGPDAVLDLIDAQGELESFRRLQRQPFQRGRSIEQQLTRFFGGRSGNKIRYAALLAGAVEPAGTPAPLAGLLDAVAGP